MFEKKKDKEFEKRLNAADKKNNFKRYTRRMVEAYRLLLDQAGQIEAGQAEEYHSRLIAGEDLLEGAVTFINGFYTTGGNSYTFLVETAEKLEELAKKEYGSSEPAEVPEESPIFRERLTDLPADPDLSAQLAGINEGLDGIAAYVRNHPEAEKEANKLFEYYISECRNICDKWMELEKAGETSEESKREFSDLLKNLNAMIAKTKHDLYENVRTSISVDAGVEQKMMSIYGKQ